MSTIQTSVLELRNHLGDYLDSLKDRDLINITKRGKNVGVIIKPEDAEEFFKWKKRQSLKKLYYNSKPIFQKYGDNFLQKKGLNKKELTSEELIEIIDNA